MFLKKSFSINTPEISMDYIVLGKGKTPFMILMGIDSFTTLSPKSIALSYQFWYLLKNYKIYIFSRKNSIPGNYSIQEMAEDQSRIMDVLNIQNAHVMGLSMGGMIAQELAINHPEKVKKLILCVTSAELNPVLKAVLERWIELAENDNYKELVINVMEKNLSEKNLKKMKILYPVIRLIGRPKNMNRFLIQAHACYNHSTYERLKNIKCPTFIIGGRKDKIMGSNASEELANSIPNSQVQIYPDYGHATVVEVKDSNRRILEFLERD